MTYTVYAEKPYGLVWETAETALYACHWIDEFRDRRPNCEVFINDGKHRIAEAELNRRAEDEQK